MRAILGIGRRAVKNSKGNSMELRNAFTNVIQGTEAGLYTFCKYREDRYDELEAAGLCGDKN